MDNDVANLIKIGQVSSVDPSTCTVRVTFDDLDDTVTGPLKVMQQSTVGRKDFSLPEVGEHVRCTFLPNGMQEGFVDGSFYTTSNPPKGELGVYRTEYSDGTLIEYDTSTSTFTLSASSDIKIIVAGTAKIEASNVEINGNISVDGNVVITGSLKASGIEMTTHKHGGVQSGISTTGAPSN